MKAEDRAYCAGLFEGEGNISFSISNKNVARNRKTACPSRSIKITIRMTDLFPLTLFEELVDTGSVRGPYYNGSNKPIYSYTVTGYERVQHVVCQIWDWLSPRRKNQIVEALTEFKQFEIKQPKKIGFYRNKVNDA